MRSVIRPAIATLVFSVGFVLMGGTAFGRDISGTISGTLTISEDSQLVGDVNCTVQGAACIAFGASGVTLKMNGFTMTGLADPITGCKGVSTRLENGISTEGYRGVIIHGPGVVQRFRANGILVFAGSVRALVERVTASTNCQAGILVSGSSTTDNDVEANILIRNGHISFECGGI